MRQLSLFDEHLLRREALLPGPGELGSVEGATAGQLDLFGQRTLRLVRAAEAIAAGELDEARVALAAIVASIPGDIDVQRQAANLAALQRQLRKAEGSPAPAAGLLEVARSLEPASGAWERLRRLLLRRVGQALREAQGDHGELEGQPAGFYFLEAGAIAEAQASLAAAASVQRCARTVFLLADAATLLGEPVARRLYLEALLRDPFDAALASARDEAVRALPDVVCDELEIEDEPVAWSAPTGIVMGVLPRPGRAALEDGWSSGPARSPEQQRALAGARRFVEALAVASSPELRNDKDAVIDARRTMKQLAPTLFAAYLERAGAKLGR